MSQLARIPSIEQLRQRPGVRALESEFGAEAVLDALRAAAADAREQLQDAAVDYDRPALADRIERAAGAAVRSRFTSTLQPAINATGVIVHTNLGRAPLSRAAVERVGAIAHGYATLEYDRHTGERGRRDVHAEALLCTLTGAEAATVVNNNAAAMLLVLAALAHGREVVVSRGELVEIGGGFRIPDVMRQSGAVLREVGTTNKTRASDYAAAVGERTALILRVHPSNFRIEGFAERPSLDQLVEVGRRLDVPVVEDLGSGYLAAAADDPLTRAEPTVASSIAAGAGLCCFSGDKLLGGPQAGIIVGQKMLVDAIRRHALMRALRVDKMIYAALEATLVDHAAGRARAAVPVQRMLSMTADAALARAKPIVDAINAVPGWKATLVAGESAVGGGSAPGVPLATWLIAVEKAGVSAGDLDNALRHHDPIVVGRIENGRVVLDVRTVLDEQLPQLARLPLTV